MLRATRLLLSARAQESNIATLVLRVSIGSLMAFHGFEKVSNFSTYSTQFPDPIGLGSGVALGLVVTAEFFGGIALCLGFLTRVFSLMIFITMAVAVFIIHVQDAFAMKELAVLFLLTSSSIMISGAGKYSLDFLILKKLTQ
ncbi:MAG: DoxX family protein [Bacteroidota bacterium]